MNEDTLLRWLAPEVDLLCLDAGNTVVFLDHERLVASAKRAGFVVSAAALMRAEDEAMRAVFRGDAVRLEWSRAEVPAARGWGVLLGTLLVAAGAGHARASALLDSLWEEHLALNFWSRVADGLVEALKDARSTGLRIVVVSNSEGRLESLFAQIGILEAFDRVVDSGVVGIEKPDPRIFHIALEAAGVPASRAVHLGDSDADVLGAIAAGLRVGLIDPCARLYGRHPEVPRVESALQVVRWLTATARLRLRPSVVEK
jgi:HAD superfamily hydrolase (TIGR01509 family)